VFSLNDIYREIAAAVGKRRKPLVHFPLWWGRFLARRFEKAARRGWIADPPLTRDQLKSLGRDNVADTSATLEAFPGPWRAFRPGIREYLPRGREHDPRFGTGGASGPGAGPDDSDPLNRDAARGRVPAGRRKTRAAANRGPSSEAHRERWLLFLSLRLLLRGAVARRDRVLLRHVLAFPWCARTSGLLRSGRPRSTYSPRPSRRAGGA
jgi:hypothetical protein